jgi:hypothetical protein
VEERDDEFLMLFPHRFDYIWAEYLNPSAAVEWKTESRHPLSDRLIRQGAYLYGVRFGAETNYCLLDIDIGSFYHPKSDPFAISRITAALEPLGLVSCISCTSSYSGGLHLYFPFQEAQSSWQLAIAVACLLENAGFKLQPGQLEIFPNPKPYAANGSLSLFNAHRLPLQIGSYLLNEAFQPIWSDFQTFVKQWQLTQQRNDIDGKILKRILKQARHRHYGISGKAEKFINDLNAEIELGWTGYGQTNRLLGRITMRAFIFHHVLFGGEPLKGTNLINEIVKTAQSLPGYQEWCRHQHELEHRAEEWARCIENSHYFHFGKQPKQVKPETQDPDLAAAIDQSPTWNQRQSAATRDRIRWAIADLLETNSLPSKPTARFQSLLKYGIGGASLYRHRDLWHPNYFETHSYCEDTTSELQPLIENSSEPLNNINNLSDETSIQINRHSSTSLLSTDGGNSSSSKGSSDLPYHNAPSSASNTLALSSSSQSSQEIQYVQKMLFNIKDSKEAFQEASRIARAQYQRIKTEVTEWRQIDRMQQFLESDDPILIAEAMAWAQINPGILNLDQTQLSLLSNAEGQEVHDSQLVDKQQSQFGIRENGDDYSL